MKIVGCDLHTRYQQIAMMDEATGELTERRLDHESGEAHAFYRELQGPVRVGIEATGPTRICRPARGSGLDARCGPRAAHKKNFGIWEERSVVGAVAEKCAWNCRKLLKYTREKLRIVPFSKI